MRKVSFLTVLLLASLMLLLPSCRSTVTEVEFTDEEYDQVLNLVLDKARSDSIIDIFKSLNEGSEDMIPSEFEFFEEYRYQVPGLDGILKNWAQTTMNHLVPSFDIFQQFVTELFSSVQAPNSRELLESGETSISDYYEAQCSDALYQNIYEFNAGLQVTELREAIVQYAAWSSTRALLYNTENPSVSTSHTDDELRALVSEYLVDLFFSYLSRHESMFRTTPDPEMDSLAAAILGLQ